MTTPPSDSRDSRDLLEVVEKVEHVGVDTVRSRRGIASRAREGETLGQGDEGRRSGELSVLAGGVVARSAMVAAAASLCRDGMGCVTGDSRGGVFWERRSGGAVLVAGMVRLLVCCRRAGQSRVAIAGVLPARPVWNKYAADARVRGTLAR